MSKQSMPGSLQENLLATLAWSDEHGKKIAARVDAELFEGDYRTVADGLLEFWKNKRRSPKAHTPDLFPDVLKATSKRRNTFLNLFAKMEEVSSHLDTAIVDEQLDEFIHQQNLKPLILEMAELLEAGGAGTAAKVKEALQAGIAKIESGASRPLVGRPLSEFEEQEISWLWWPFIPLGETTVVFGDGGIGKSTVLIDIAARISTGKKWPDLKFKIKNNKANLAPLGTTLILTHEDKPGSVLLPRLNVAGGDPHRVRFVGYEVPNAPAEFDAIDHLDIPRLEELIEQIGDVKMIVIDPITDFAGKADTYNDAQVRAFLKPLDKLAARHKLAVVIVLHMNKKEDLSAKNRALGSVAFTNVPRSALFVAADPDDDSCRYMAQTKYNLTGPGVTVSLRLEPRRDYVRIRWRLTLSNLKADDLSKPKRQSEGETKSTKAEKLLREQLEDGPCLSTDLTDIARERGISERTLGNAKRALGIKSTKCEGGAWWWRLPR